MENESVFDGSSIVYLPSRRKTPLIIIFDPQHPEFDSMYDAEQLEMHLRNALPQETWHMVAEMIASRIVAGAAYSAYENMVKGQDEEKPPRRPRLKEDPLDPEP